MSPKASLMPLGLFQGGTSLFLAERRFTSLIHICPIYLLGEQRLQLPKATAVLSTGSWQGGEEGSVKYGRGGKQSPLLQSKPRKASQAPRQFWALSEPRPRPCSEITAPTSSTGGKSSRVFTLSLSVPFKFYGKGIS